MNQLALNLSTIQQWVLQNITEENAVKQLADQGFDELTIDLYLKEFKKQRYAKRQWKGFMLMGIGAFLGFISCVATMTDLLPEWRAFFLYGVTFAGVSMVCWGMYLVFEE
jgi:hypothetical protein